MGQFETPNKNATFSWRTLSATLYAKKEECSHRGQAHPGRPLWFRNRYVGYTRVNMVLRKGRMS